jgi:hypothetical protein
LKEATDENRGHYGQVDSLGNLSSGERAKNYRASRICDRGVPLATVKQAMTFLQSGTHVILDARPAADYEAGHIPTALSIPYDSIGNNYQPEEMVDMGRIRCIYIFRVPACLELLVLRNVWKLVLAALYA